MLHTGDIRCDKLFMRSLRRNPAVQQFMTPPSNAKGKEKAGQRVLDRIHLDTAAMCVIFGKV